MERKNDSAESKKNIHRLSAVISHNYLCKRFSEKIDAIDDLKSKLEEKTGRNIKSKVILIVGAGASVEANLANGDKIAKTITERINTTYGKEFKEVITAEATRISIAHNQYKDSFETLLQSLCKYSKIKREVEYFLGKEYNSRYQPLLSYELIAHLFKHRAIDTIINFNFDELLDQSIQDELRPDQYFHVLFDGDYKEGLAKSDKPIYLKPHGTISHPSTLRFTRDDYSEIFDNVVRIMEECIGDEGIVNFIVFGFEMESPEFNSILRSKFSNKKLRGEFYYIKRSFNVGTASRICDNQKKSEDYSNIKDFFIHAELNYYPFIKKKITASAVWKIILESCNDILIDTFKIPNFGRHILISNIFRELNICNGVQCNNNDYECNLIDYLFSRVIVELIFLVAINKYKINLSLVKQSKVWNYYIDYKKHILQENSNRNNCDKSIIPCLSLLQICNGLGLKYNHTHQIFNFTDCNIENVPEFMNIVRSNSISFMQKHLDSHIGVNRYGILQRIIDELTTDNVEDYSKSIQYRKITNVLNSKFNGPNKEIDRYSDGLLPFIFSDEKQYTKLKTRADLYWSFKEICCGGSSWSHLLLATHFGEWLANPMIKELFEKSFSSNSNPKRHIYILASDKNIALKHTAYLKDINELSCKVNKLHWKKHEHFIILFLKEQKNNLVPISAIYYLQKYDSPNVYPVLINPNDTNKNNKKSCLEVMSEIASIYTTLCMDSEISSECILSGEPPFVPDWKDPGFFSKIFGTDGD